MKKYIINALYISLIGLFVLMQASCSDLLDQKPQGQWTNNPAGSLESDVFTLYARIRHENITSSLPALAIHSYRSEDAEKGSIPSDAQGEADMFDNFSYTANNGSIQSYWTQNYSIIHLANRILDTIKQIETLSPEQINEGILTSRAEASFFRAYCYFNLVRAFGEVPLIDFKLTNSIQANIPKSPVSDIYALIDADLTEAEKLPQTWPSRFIGRFTSGAAKALHAKTYMMRSDWTNAYAAATTVITSGLYNLDTPYEKIFRESGENTRESVLELQCTANAGAPESLEIGSRFAQVQGVRGANQWDLGWGFNCPTPLLAAAFEAGDPRKDETLLYFLRPGDDPNSIPANRPWGEKPIAQSTVMNTYYNKKAYTDPDYRARFTRFGYWYNIRLIRYSDVVLMAAEAANELGNTTEALKYLEMVRKRARAGNSSILPEVTTTDKVQLRNAIRHERRVELGMEFDRFYDLVRWGIARTVLHAAGKTGYQDKNALLPLPQNEVDKSNGVLKQNPNY